MLDAIRQLTQNLKLKDLIIANFIPEDLAKSIEKRASWNAEEETWVLQVHLYISLSLSIFLCVFARSSVYVCSGWRSLEIASAATDLCPIASCAGRRQSIRGIESSTTRILGTGWIIYCRMS